MSYNPLPQPADVVVNTGVSTSPVSFSNPFPVSLGSSNITITGDVNVGTTVSVTSTPQDPVHTHITEVGSSGILEDENIPYLPVGISSLLNTVSISNTSFYILNPVTSVTVGGTVSIANTVSISNTSFYITNPVTSVTVGGTVSIANTVSISNTSFYITNPVTTVAVSGIGSTVTVQGTVGIGTTGQVSLNLNSAPVSSSNPLPVTGNIGLSSSGNIVRVGLGTTTIELVDNNKPFPVYLANITATSKRRLEISTYETNFFNTFQFNKETDVWDERVSIGGNSIHIPTLSGIGMSVTSSAGSEVIRQTRNVMKYIPGRDCDLAFAIRLTNPVIGVRRRFGLFDENDGIYFEDGGDGDYYCCVRNSNGASAGIGTTTLTRIPRSQWNGDKLDGNGVSRITADPDAQQIVNFHYEWYGAGRIEYQFVIDGTIHTIHTIDNANKLKGPWCATPFLPIRCEITNVTGAAGTHYLYQGSNSLTTNGLQTKSGIAGNISSPITGTDLGSSYTFTPVLSIRLKTIALKGIVLPTFFQVATVDNTNLFYRLIRNAPLTNPVWVDNPDPNGFTQYDVSASGIGTTGVIIDSGFFITGGGAAAIALDKETIYQIGRSGIGTISDTFTIACASAISNKNAVAALTWIEQR
jgi:hypothetical protein